VTPADEVRVSGRLREDWENGHRYYPFDRQKLLSLEDGVELLGPTIKFSWLNL